MRDVKSRVEKAEELLVIQIIEKTLNVSNLVRLKKYLNSKQCLWKYYCTGVAAGLYPPVRNT